MLCESSPRLSATRSEWSPQPPFPSLNHGYATLRRLVATRAVEPVPPPPTLESTSAATFKHHAAEDYAEPPPRWRPLTARTVALLSAARPVDVDRLGVTIDHRAYAGGDAALDAPVTIYSMRLPEGAFHGVTAVRGLHPFGGDGVPAKAKAPRWHAAPPIAFVRRQVDDIHEPHIRGA